MLSIYVVLATLMVFSPQTAFEQELDIARVTANNARAEFNQSAVVAFSAPPEFPEILARISYCESRNRQFNTDGKVLRGKLNRHDVGKFQINEFYWKAKAENLGIDLHTEEGNEIMALELYRAYGAAPWVHSKNCWDDGRK